MRQHTTENSVRALRVVFDERIIIPGLWTSRPSDLNVCGFYLCGNFK